MGLSTLALPSIVRAASATTLKFVPQIDLAFLDPHWTIANVTRGHGYIVFDTLYGQDGTFTPQRQMLQGHVVEKDGKLWKLTLRPGLVWHDRTPVLARDCVANIRRWAARDAYGGALMAATDDLSASDDKTIRFRLKKPFPLLPYARSKPTTPSPVMMPERLALTDPFKQITEMVGSGPFRFVANERVPGATNVYRRFDKYVPRDSGTPDWTAGPKVVHLKPIGWTTITDAGTKAAALQAGEQDWWENPTHDLLPLLRKDKNIRIVTINPTGSVNMMRPNHLQPPFNNPTIQQALFYAIDQTSFMEAIVGNDPSMYATLHGFFCPNTPMGSTAGLNPLRGERDYGKVKQMLKTAGYADEKVVMVVATDYAQFEAIGDVAAGTAEQRHWRGRLALVTCAACRCVTLLRSYCLFCSRSAAARPMIRPSTAIMHPSATRPTSRLAASRRRTLCIFRMRARPAPGSCRRSLVLPRCAPLFEPA
jgi:peptide/nickel transport system substrate-binding protein